MCFANLPVSTQSPVIKYSVSNKFSLDFYRLDLFLQIGEKAPGVCAIHLCMMELERQGQCRFEDAAPIPSPDYKGVIEDAAVHAHSTVDFNIGDRRGADEHTVCQVVILAVFSDLLCQPQVVLVE